MKFFTSTFLWRNQEDSTFDELWDILSMHQRQQLVKNSMELIDGLTWLTLCNVNEIWKLW